MIDILLTVLMIAAYAIGFALVVGLAFELIAIAVDRLTGE